MSNFQVLSTQELGEQNEKISLCSIILELEVGHTVLLIEYTLKNYTE